MCTIKSDPILRHRIAEVVSFQCLLLHKDNKMDRATCRRNYAYLCFLYAPSSTIVWVCVHWIAGVGGEGRTKGAGTEGG